MEFGIGHDDLIWGGAWFICRKAWDMVKYLMGSMNSSYDSPCGRFASASEYKVPSKASYTGFGTRLVVERVRHHSCGPSISPQHSITEWACWNEMGRSGLSMMKAIARVVPTGVCKCRFRHSGATLRTHATKSVSPGVSAGLGTLGDEGPSGPPSWVES